MVKIVSRYLTLFVLGVVMTVASLAALFYFTGIPHEIIRDITQREMSKVLKQPVSIERVSGNLLFSATLHNVRLFNKPGFPNGTVIKISELVAHYNVIDGIRFKGDFAKASDVVEVNDAVIYMLRDKKDQWNVLHILPPPDPKAPPPTFTGRLLFQNMTVYFRDEKGWGDHPELFQNQFNRLYGVMDFGKLHKTKLYFTGNLSGDSKQALKITGLFNALNGAYDIVFSSIHTDMKTWGNYVLNRNGYAFLAGETAVKGRVRSKDTYIPAQTPMWYDIKMTVSKTTFRVPYLKAPFKELSGRLHVYSGLHSRDIMSSKVWEQARKEKLIDKQGQQLYVFTPHLESRLKTTFPEQLKETFKKPPVIVRFFDTKAKLNNVAVAGKGMLDLAYHTVDIQFDSSHTFTVDQLGGVVPGIAGLGFSGQVQKGKAVVSGTMEAPLITASLESAEPVFARLAAKHVVLDAELKNKIVTLTLKHGELFNTGFTGSGTVDLNQTPARFHLKAFAPSVDPSEVNAEFAKYMQGKTGLTVEITGHSKAYQVHSWISDSSVRLYGQHVSQFDMTGSVDANKNYTISSGKLWLNSGKNALNFTGALKNLDWLQLSFEGKDMRLADLDKETPASQFGKWDAEGALLLTLSKDFWKSPLSAVSLQLKSTIKDYVCLGETYPFLTLEGEFHNNEVLLKHFSAKIGGGNIECTGTFKQLKPEHITISATHINVGKNKLLQRFVPDVMKPFSGFLSLETTLSRNNNPGSPMWGWLKDFSVKGQVTLDDATVRNQPINHLEMTAAWDGQEIDFTHLSLLHGQSALSLSGKMNQNNELDLVVNPSSVIELSDFETLFSKMGRLSGKVSLSGKISGTRSDPFVDFALSAKQFKSNFLKFDALDGHIHYAHGRLSFEPLSFTKSGDVVVLKGEVDLLTLMRPNVAFSDLDYQLDMSCTNVGLATISDLIEGIWKEIKTKSLEQDLLLKETVTNSNRKVEITPANVVASPGFDKSVVPLYQQGETSTLSFYGDIYKRFEDIQRPEELGIKDWIKGQVTAQISAKSRRGKPPEIVGRVELSNLDTFLLKAESVRLSLDTQQEKVLFASKIENGFWGPKKFTKFLTTGQMDQNGMVSIGSSELTVDTDSHKNILTGRIKCFGDDADALDLTLTLQKNDIGLLSFLTSSLNDIQNEGSVELFLTGSLKEPKINSGRIALKQAKIILNPEATSVTSPMLITTSNIAVKDNVVLVRGLGLNWQGTDTQKLHSSTPVLNKLSLKGQLNLEKFTFVSPTKFLINMDFQLQDTSLSINFPKLYKGDIDLRKVAIKGAYVVPISSDEKKAFANRLATDTEDGPVISGEVDFSNGEVVIPTLGKRNPKPSFLLNLDCSIKKDITLTGSLIDQELLNTFGLGLSPTSVKVLGSVNFPKPQSSLVFSEGTVKIFNRAFSLLSPDKQRIYFSDKQYKILRNTISFSVQENKALGELKNVPSLELIALTVIDPDPAEVALRPSDPDVTKYKHVLVSINGPVYNLSAYTFDRYDSDVSIPRDQKVSFKSSASLSNSVDSTGAREFDKVVEMLLPDFYDSNKGSSSRIDSQTTRLINQLSESQLNTVIQQQIRPIEKQIARNIGIYDIKVDYNAGGALLKATNIQGFGSDNQTLGVNFFQNLLSDQLFLRVKTSLDSKTQKTNNNFQLSEVELNYYFFNNFSMNYSNFLNDNGVDYRAKTAVKYRYEF